MNKEVIGKIRWSVCGLIFFATTINYLDRAVISLLKRTLEVEFTWTETDYANIVIAFQLCYALGMTFSGSFIDKLGSRVGYALTVVLWSVAGMLHGFVTTTLGFMLARAALGLTESGNFPAAIKTIAEWFPKKERAFATGIFNSGTNVGAIVTPLTVPFIARYWGWQWAFFITGSLGFLWVIAWLYFYRLPTQHKKLLPAEFEHIHSDLDEKQDATSLSPSFSWRRLLTYRQTWAFALGKFFTDPVWWFYLFWLPDFLKKQYGLSETGVVFPIAFDYTLAGVGSIFGGWLPLYFIRKGWPVFRARKTSMFIYAVTVLPVVFAQWAGSINMWFAILIIGLAMSAHQAWSANIFTTTSDMFPKPAVASVVGIGGMFGAFGGMLFASLAGKLFDYYKGLGHEQTGYFIMLIICGCAYILAWTLMHVLVPRMKRVSPR